MPLTKLFRLGATPQRLSKGYVIAGDPKHVTRVLSRLNDTYIAGIHVAVPDPKGRAITLWAPWALLFDRHVRDDYRDGLVAAVTTLSATIRKENCALLPSAVRGTPGTRWSEWVCGDVHEVALLSSVEAERANNLLREFTPHLIAVTGRAGIDAERIENLGSRRLAESTEHLATRHLASASPRNLEVISTELRRTSGLSSLASMDVHPSDGGRDRLSCTVRAVDGQAFVGTSIAHALTIQAIVMHARRLVRDSLPLAASSQELLEAQRAAAIMTGVGARVPVHSGAGRRDNHQTASMSVLVREMFDLLEPEFGTLEAAFREVVPVLGWTVLPPGFPRNETEFIATRCPKDSAGLAALIGSPESHVAFNLLSQNDAVTSAGAGWERRVAAPPPFRRTNRRPSGGGGRSSGEPARDRGATGSRRGPGPNSGGRQDQHRRLEALAALKDVSEEDRRKAVWDLIGRLSGASVELAPWLGPASAELVKAARAGVRPAGQRRLECAASAVRVGSPKVGGAVELATKQGLAVLVVTGTPDEIDAAKRALVGIIEGLPGGRAAILGKSVFRDSRAGEQRATLEVLFVGADPAS